MPPATPNPMSEHRDDSSLYIVDFMRFPGEIRNNIYDFIICGLPPATTVMFLPAIACISKAVHHEFMSHYLPKIHSNIASMQEIWDISTLLETHPNHLRLERITKLTITNFTSIAHTPTRANEVMDFLCQFKSLNHLVFDIVLDDLHHGFQGRIKDIDHIFIEFELFRIPKFPKLAKLVVNVKSNGVPLTPGDISLLFEMEDRLAGSVGGDVVFIHSE